MFLKRLLSRRKAGFNPEQLIDDINLIAQYGDILETESKKSDVFPLSKLPADEDQIKDAIKYVYASLQKNSIIEYLVKDSPAHYDIINTSDYINALGSGFVQLAAFIQDDDVKYCRKCDNQMRRVKSTKSPAGLENVIQELSIGMEKYVKIHEDVGVKSQKLLIEFNKYISQFTN